MLSPSLITIVSGTAEPSQNHDSTDHGSDTRPVTPMNASALLKSTVTAMATAAANPNPARSARVSSNSPHATPAG
jgi:hypothetical protein